MQLLKAQNSFEKESSIEKEREKRSLSRNREEEKPIRPREEQKASAKDDVNFLIQVGTINHKINIVVTSYNR